MKILKAVAMEKCIGCHACSLACARLVNKCLSWTNSGIRIKSSGGLTTGFEATICLACKPASCAAACPTGACAERKEGGARIKREKCIQCGKCSAACPANAIFFDQSVRIPYLCLHCGQCVPFCPHECITLSEHKSFASVLATKPEDKVEGKAANQEVL